MPFAHRDDARCTGPVARRPDPIQLSNSQRKPTLRTPVKLGAGPPFGRLVLSPNKGGAERRQAPRG